MLDTWEGGVTEGVIGRIERDGGDARGGSGSLRLLGSGGEPVTGAGVELAIRELGAGATKPSRAASAGRITAALDYRAPSCTGAFAPTRTTSRPVA